MPLLRFDMIEGRDEKSIRELLDTAHDAVLKAFGVPLRDRYQIVHQHPAHELIIEDTGLGIEQIGRQRFDGLAYLQQPHSDGVEDQAVGQSSAFYLGGSGSH